MAKRQGDLNRPLLLQGQIPVLQSPRQQAVWPFQLLIHLLQTQAPLLIETALVGNLYNFLHCPFFTRISPL